MDSQKTQAINERAEKALASEAELEQVVVELESDSRRNRQMAASVLAAVAKVDPEKLVPFIDAIINSLDQPEAQTRWECLDVLTLLVPLDSRACDKALLGAEAALFDEDNGMVRLAAVRFICKLGATTENRSIKTWSLLDEAIQCYHGDFEYQDMLTAIIGYSEGKLAPEVKEGLKSRVAFDAEHATGALRRRSQQIVENLS